MNPNAMAALAGACFGVTFTACQAAPTAAVSESSTAAPAVQSLDPGAGAGNRPIVLNYKDERERVALLGLTYTVEGVTIDQAEAARIVNRPDEDQARAAFEAGLAEIQRNASLAAVSAHTRAVLLSPDDARMYEGLGDALRVARFEQRAEAAYRTALSLEPSATGHVKLAELLWMRAERQPAIEHALHALASDAANLRAHANLARWYYFTGAFGLAWEYVHRSEAIGAPLPSQFRPLLAARMAEPSRSPK